MTVITRIQAPTPTAGPSPSHAPPDTRYAPGISLARGLGWFGIGLGMAGLLAPRAMASLTGVRHPALIQAHGLREIITSVGILISPRPVAGCWSRVAGDVLDVATLGAALATADGEDRKRALVSLLSVAGVTALDVLSSMQLTTAAALEG